VGPVGQRLREGEEVGAAGLLFGWAGREEKKKKGKLVGGLGKRKRGR
jgi:hypothetical protein